MERRKLRSSEFEDTEAREGGPRETQEERAAALHQFASEATRLMTLVEELLLQELEDLRELLRRLP